MSATALVLPPALAVWADLFADMPEPHLRLLATLVSALSPLVDKAEAAGMRPRGEVDSFSGIGTRGGIERLLTSEWLWRDLAPDEFLRRVAEREALTFEPVHRQAADARTVLVVLDAGPAMLGRPRLVAFAALLCLAASAKGRGARLLWSSNAVAKRGWREALTRTDITLLLDHVSATALREDEISTMLAAPILKRHRRKLAPSLWLIGSGALPKVAMAAGGVMIEEVPRLDEARLTIAAHVVVTSATGRSAAASFDLPDEAEATALLRQPFRTTRAGKPPPTPRGEPEPSRIGRKDWAQRRIRFTVDGRHLIVALRDGVLLVPTDQEPGVIAWRVPLARYEHLVGLDLLGDYLRIATATRYAARGRIVWRETRLGAWQPKLQQIFANDMPPDHPLIAEPWPRDALPCLGRPGGRPRFWTLAPDGAAYLVSAEGVVPYAPLAAGAMLALCDAAILIRKPKGEIVACNRGNGRTMTRYRAPRGLIEDAASLDLMIQDGTDWLVAHKPDGGWHLAEAYHGRTIELPTEQDGERIVGFAGLGDADTPAALTIDGDGNVALRDVEWDAIYMTHLSDADPAVLLAVHGGKDGPWLAAAYLDDDGFVERLTFGRLASCRRWEPTALAELIEQSTCLRD